MVKGTKKEHLILPLMEKFISDCRKGRRLQKNGKKLTAGSASKYEYLLKHLTEYSEYRKIELRVVAITRLSKRDLEREKKYWDKFYLTFTNFLYDQKDLFDNYVGTQIKLLRAFFNYLEEEKSIMVGSFHKRFYAHQEDIPIIALEPEQLNFLIYNQPFREQLPPRLKKTLSTFIFGCSVALRYSDLMALSPHNIQLVGGQPYIVTTSIKTQTTTRVKIPQYALDNLPTYQRRKKLLPQLSKTNFNIQIKEIGELAGWTHVQPKYREKRGVPTVVYKDPSKKEHYRFCDNLSSHTMRRTAITTMLMLGMDELMVRRISGHAANSKEFFKYVNVVQSYLDKQSEDYFSKLEKAVL